MLVDQTDPTPDSELAFVGRVHDRKDFLAPADAYPGVDRIFFGSSEFIQCDSFSLSSSNMATGTDHPFFPPLDGEGSRWKSVDENLDAIAGVAGWGDEERAKVMGRNAVELFGLDL